MKPIKYSAAVILILSFVIPLTANAAKWKGNWYLRGQDVCKEITLDRKGRTTMSVYPKAIVEEQDKEFYLTVESMGKKYSYHMLPREETLGFDLSLISVGPNQPVPGRSGPEGAYTAVFRKMVDCQVTMAGGLEEAPAK